MRKTLFLILAAALAGACFVPAFAQGGARPLVVASTPWTAAFVKAAGVDDCHVIAPYEMQHPPEYELRPRDIQVVSGAALFVYAGYETMMKTLASNAAAGRIAMVKIQTDYDPENMKKSIRAIAAAAGTESRAEKNIAALERTFAECRAGILAAGGSSRPVAVHSFQKRLAELFGFKVVGVFGPGPLEARQVAELTKADASLVVDNWHNPVSQPLRETMPRAAFAELINFPGKDGTRTLEDVLRYNTDRLLEALGKKWTKPVSSFP